MLLEVNLAAATDDIVRQFN